MERILLNNYLFHNYTVSEVLYLVFVSVKAATLVLLLFAAYRFLRPKLPARVNCWFCNKYSLVSYHDRNCWDCTYCEQYNGFKTDGDYNMDIRKRMTHSETPDTADSEKLPTNGLCQRCNINQQLKVQQLARFTPINEHNYDEEIEQYRKQLDISYRLCGQCEQVLSQTLQSQHYNLLANRMNNHRVNEDGFLLKNFSKSSLLPLKTRVGVLLQHVSSLALSVVIASSAASLLEDVTDSWLPLLGDENLSGWLAWMGNSSKEVCVLGALAFMSSHIVHPSRFSKLSIVLWFATSILSWTSCHVGILLILSIFNLILQGQIITVFKKPESHFKKTEFSVEKTTNFDVAPAVENKAPNLQQAFAKSLEKFGESEKLPLVVKHFVQEPKRVKKRSLPQKQRNSSIRTRSQSAGKQESIEEKSVQTEERSRLFSPPREVYEGFNNLHLTPISAETPNIIQSKIPEKKWNGIIKPAKFIPNDSYDPSRSSTPSSASSQRIVKEPDQIFDCKSTTPDINNYCNKISPVCSKFTPPSLYGVEYNDYNSMHPGFYNNGYTPPPYQMYPGPMGHTTFYTYTRPTPFPYGFPSQRFSPPYEYSSPLSPRISEVGSSTHSVSGNLFVSPSVADKWRWVKRTFYAASIVFNIVSVSVLLISYWYGKVQIFGD